MFLVIRNLDLGEQCSSIETSYVFVTESEELATSWASAANEEIMAARHAYDARFDSVEKNSVLNETNWKIWAKKILQADAEHFSNEDNFRSIYDIDYEAKTVSVR